MQIASFEKRLFAYLIDYLLLLAGNTLLFIFVFMNILKLNYAYAFLIVPLLTSIGYIFFVGLLTYFTNGLSLGNIIFNLRMVSIKFHKLSLRQVLVKFVPLSLFPCVVVNALYMVIKHTEKTIFDELSHTVSISMG